MPVLSPFRQVRASLPDPVSVKKKKKRVGVVIDAASFVFDFIDLRLTNILNTFSDKNLVSKPSNQVEKEVHKRTGGACPAVLQLHGLPGPSSYVPGRQAVAVQLPEQQLPASRCGLAACGASGAICRTLPSGDEPQVRGQERPLRRSRRPPRISC